MWSYQGKYNLRIKNTLVTLISIILSLCFGPTVKPSFSKTQTKTEREFKIFCREVKPVNPLCLKWNDLIKEKLTLEVTLRHSISSFCNQNPLHPLCKKSTPMSPFTYCSQIEPENNDCKRWKSLKQAELEVKGLLAEEIQKFCLNNSTHPFCKTRKK